MPGTEDSALATKYLEHLHGIEIGASTQNSFKLKRSINVDFSDEQGGLWQDKNCEPATVIRPGGYIFIIAPHKDRTFDKARKVTPQPIRSPKTRLTC